MAAADYTLTCAVVKVVRTNSLPRAMFAARPTLAVIIAPPQTKGAKGK